MSPSGASASRSTECRPPFLGIGEWTSIPIAQLRYEGDGLWSLYFGDRFCKWTEYVALRQIAPSARSDW
jgi:hypothetical protein